MNFGINIESVWSIAKEFSGMIAILSCIIEFTPIKLHPISYVCRKLGGAFNRDLRNDINNLREEVTTLQQNLGGTEKKLTEIIDENQRCNTERYIKQLRGEILNFANECRADKWHFKDEFDHIIEAHEEYERLIESLGLVNGKVTLEYEYILNIYRNCQEANSFL